MQYELKWTNFFKVYCTFEDLSQHESKYWENLLWEQKYEIPFYNLKFDVHILCYDDWESVWTDAYLDYKGHMCTSWQRDWNVFDNIIDYINEITKYLYKNTGLILSLTGH